MHPYLQNQVPIPFAHRGGASSAPENSLLAFRKAVEMGYRYLETDVHITRDGVLVAFHDERLDRVTDRAGLIRELDFAAVSLARIDGSEPIPTLEQLIDEFPKARFNIDTKHDSSVQPLIEFIQVKGLVDRVMIGSFKDARQKQIRTGLGEAVATSMGPKSVARLILASMGIPTGKFAEVAAQIPFSLVRRPRFARRLLKAAHRRNIAVHIWTVDDPEQMEYLLDLGVDGIMTDDIATLKSVFEQRGIWPQYS